MKQSEKDALQEKIDELQARLDEQVEEPKKRGIVYGDVYETCVGGSVILASATDCCGRETGIQLEGLLGPDVGTTNSSNGYWHNAGSFLGTFVEVFVRRSKAREELRQELKEGFMKMKDRCGDTAEFCEKTKCNFAIRSTQLDSFIDNLFDGKNCDGSDRK
jgi:hypothetical protein